MKKNKGISLIVIVAILNILGIRNSGWLPSFFASILFIMASIPIMKKLEKKDETLPFFEFISLAYILFFSIPVFFLDAKEDFYFYGWAYISESVLVNSLIIVNIGYIFLCLGFYGMERRNIIKFFPRVKIGTFSSYDITKAAFLLFFLGVSSDLYAQLFRVPFVFKAVFYFFRFFSRIGVGLLFIEYLKGRLSPILKIVLFFAFIPYILIKDFSGGSLAPLILDASLFLFLIWYVRRKLPIIVFIVGMLIFLPFLESRPEFRSHAWFGGKYSKTGSIKRTGLYFKLVREGFKEKKLSIYLDGWDFFMQRVNHISELGACITKTPGEIPYWWGHSFKPLSTAVFPRFLMPWKPEENMGQEYGHRYNFLHPSDTGTSFNLPMINELYINFGLIGIIAGMFLIGFVYRILYHILNYEGLSNSVAVIAAIVFMGLMNIESNVSLVFGNVIEYVIVMYIIFLLLKTRSYPKIGEETQT